MSMKQKKGQPISVRFPDKVKRAVEDEAARNMRSQQDEILRLVIEALHVRKFNPNDYL